VFFVEMPVMSVDKLAQVKILRQFIAPWAALQDGHPSEVPLDMACRAARTAEEPGLHEIRSASYRDSPAAAGFACALTVLAAARRPGGIVWIAQPRGAQDFGFPYGPGLRDFGLDPRRLILVRVADDAEALWAAEEAARSPGVAAVLAQTLGAIALTPARRVHLAARGPAFFLRPAGVEGLGPALTRWTAASAPGVSPTLTRWAQPRWRVRLERQRSGPCLAETIMEWDNAAHRLRLGAVLAYRPADAAARTATAGPAPHRRSA
jgi:protein ImuA